MSAIAARRIRWALAAIALLAVLPLGGASLDDAGAAGRTVYFGGDIGGLVRQRPPYIHITSDQNLNRLHWRSWGGSRAKGHGTAAFGVADNFSPARINVTLSRVRRCGTRLRYLRLRITYLDPSPYGRRATVNYTCRSPFA